MKRFFILLTMATFAFTACTKDNSFEEINNNDTPTPPPPPIELMQIDATTMDATALNMAITSALESGYTNIAITLTAKPEAAMFTAIRRALIDTESVSDGSINLSLNGVTTIPHHSHQTADGYVIFGEVTQDENDKYLETAEVVLELNSISLPDVQTIGNDAFRGCENITKLDAPQVQTIGDWAFAYSKIKELELPEARTLGWVAFFVCEDLVSVKLPKATNLNQQAFDLCPNLTRVELLAEEEIVFGKEVFDNPNNINLILHSNKAGQATGTTWNGCTVASIEYLCSDGTTNHNYDKAVGNGDGTHTQICSICNCTKVERCHGGEATCQKVATCAVCGKEYGELSDHIIDHATGYCKFGCGKWMATFTIEQSGTLTYHMNMTRFENETLSDGAIVKLLTDEKDFGWGIEGNYTIDMNGYDFTTAKYSLYAGTWANTEQKLHLKNNGSNRSNVPYIRVNNCTLNIEEKVDVAAMILFYTTCTVDLTKADFTTCNLNLNLEGCNTSQFILGDYAIYDSNGNIVTGELAEALTYTIK